MQDYFPNDPLRVDRDWLWRIWLKTDLVTADKYLQKVENERQKEEKKEFPSHKYIEVDGSFLDALLKWDIKSK